MRVRPLIVWIVVLVVWAALPAAAQTTLTWDNARFEDGFVVTLPDAWPTWAQSDYESLEAADAAAVTVFGAVYGDVELPTPFVSPEMKLLATVPEAPDDGLIRFVVEMLPLSAFADAVGVDANGLSAPILAEALGGTITRSQRLNGREVAFSTAPAGTQQTYSATVIFPEQDRIAVVSLTAPEAFFAAEPTLTTLALSSLRLAGEPLAGAAVLAQTGEPLPETWILPDEIVYIEVCDLTAPRTVNLRSGPGTGFAILGALPAGASAQASGQATGPNDGVIWFQTVNGGWVRSDVVNEAATCAELPLVDVP